MPVRRSDVTRLIYQERFARFGLIDRSNFGSIDFGVSDRRAQRSVPQNARESKTNRVPVCVTDQRERQYVLSAPFVAVVEAKNDLIRTGLGQCIAAMYGAQLCNQRSGSAVEQVYGVVSTGSAWKFLRLVGTSLTIDVPEYYIDNLPKMMGILRQIVETA
jgi:hypothetical protein